VNISTTNLVNILQKAICTRPHIFNLSILSDNNIVICYFAYFLKGSVFLRHAVEIMSKVKVTLRSKHIFHSSIEDIQQFRIHIKKAKIKYE